MRPDYSRYMKKESRPQAIFLWTLAGLAASYIWMYTIGLAGAKVLVNQTAGGVQSLVGGGVIGVLAFDPRSSSAPSPETR